MDRYQEILDKAREALRKGADPAAVDTRIAELTGGEFRTFAALDVAMKETQPVSEEEQRLLRVNERGGGKWTGATKDFLSMAAHGASFGFDDELLGLFSPQARDRRRQNIEDTRALNPGASLAAEGAGGMIIPGFGGGFLGAKAAGATGSRILGAGAGAAGAGAASGFLMGAGEAEGGVADRVRGGILPGLIGGGAGFLLGAGGAGALRLGERFIPNGAVERVSGLLGGSGGAHTRAARKAVTRAFRGAEREDLLRSPGLIPKAVKEVGDEAIVADLSPSLASNARAAANKSDILHVPGGPVEKVRDRTADMPQRLSRAGREASHLEGTKMGHLRGAQADIQGIRNSMYQPLEEGWDQIPLRETMNLIEKDPVLREYANARRWQFSEGPNVEDLSPAERMLNTLRRAGTPDEQALSLIEKNGLSWERPSGGAAKQWRPTLREFQDLRSDLMKDAKYHSGGSQRMSEARSALTALDAASLREFPELNVANAAYRRVNEQVRALEAGEKAWRGNKNPEEIMAELEALRRLERELNMDSRELTDAYRMGMLDTFEKKLGERAGNNAEAGHTIRAGPTHADRLRMLADRDEDFSKFLDDIQREQTYARTSQIALGNSTTAEQLERATGLPMMGLEPKYMVARTIVKGLGLSEAEERAAYKLIGEAMYGDGADAALLVAARLSALAHLAGGTGGVVGAGAGHVAAGGGG